MGIIKQLIIQVLLIRLKKQLLDKNVTLVAVFGTEKSEYKDQIGEFLIQKGLSVRVNRPGYNHKLGTLLTLLNKKAGGRSFSSWIHIVFSNIDTKTDVIVQEFVYQEGDLKYLQKINPEVLVYTKDENQVQIDLNSKLIFSYQEGIDGAITYGGDSQNNLELTMLDEQQNGITFEYRDGLENNQVTINQFGEYSVYSYMIAQKIYENLSKEKKK